MGALGLNLSRRRCTRVWRALALAAVTATATACPLPQPEVCARYVACQEAVDASVDTSPWQDDGSCWALPDSARRCEAQCQAALEALLALPNPPAACVADEA